jgi:hypothetical protein
MENKQEIWKDVIGYEGIYQISNLGNVLSLERVVYKIDSDIPFYNQKKYVLKPYKLKTGYLQVRLSKNGSSKGKTIHSLIATAFITNVNSKPCVNHINGIKDDNRIENLEWVTHKENMQHAVKTGLWVVSGERGAASKLTDLQIIEIRNNKELNQPQLAKKYGVHQSNISLIKRNLTRKIC